MGLDTWQARFLHGFQARIKQIVLSAEYVHCYAHCLNLSVVKSCQLPLIRNMMDTVKEISYAFSYSAERSGRFKTVLKGANATLPAGAHDYVDSL